MVNVDFDFYSKFISALKCAVPERGRAATLLAEVLHIEKVAVYRRLRGEVPFTFAEIVQISKKFSLSMDNVIGIMPEFTNIPFHLHFYDYFNAENYRVIEAYGNTVKVMSDASTSELGAASLMLQKRWMVIYPELFKFFMLKWTYQFGNPAETINYSQITIPDWLQKANDEYLEIIKEIRYSFYILHENAFLSIINDIKFFIAIKLISEDDASIIKDALLKLLDTMEELTINSSYSNGNKIDLYVSAFNFDASYAYLYSKNVQLGTIDAFTTSILTSTNTLACNKIRTYLQAIKRASTLISNSEINRIVYFEKQRSLVNSL